MKYIVALIKNSQTKSDLKEFYFLNLQNFPENLVRPKQLNFIHFLVKFLTRIMKILNQSNVSGKFSKKIMEEKLKGAFNKVKSNSQEKNNEK